MEMVRHNTLGLGEVISRSTVDGITYLNVRFENGRESKLAIPFSFQQGQIEPIGALKDEVEQAIAERKAHWATLTAPATTPARKSAAKSIPTGPVAEDFEKHLIASGYKVETDNGNPSTVYSYLNAVESVRDEEGLSWDDLKNDITRIVSKYDEGGPMDWFGAKSNKTVINALKRFAEYVGKP